MNGSSDRAGRTEGLAPVHYLFGARPSGSANETETPEAPLDGARWFDPEIDGDEGFLDGGDRRREQGDQGSSTTHDRVNNGTASTRPAKGEPGNDAVDPVDTRRERDEERRVQREERAAERKARRAENVTMNALTRRGQSVQEIRDLLTAREIDADEIEAEIERLSGVGLLDDADLAQNLVRTLTERKKLGRTALMSELRRRKLDPLVVEEAMAELDRDDESDRCLELARQRARQLNSVDDQTAERRLSAFLQRKGYSGDAIRTAVRTALRDERGVRFV